VLIEDPARRRQNGGGHLLLALYVIPMSRPDIVIAANGAPVSSVADLRTAVEKSKNHIALLIQRGDARLFVPVRVG